MYPIQIRLKNTETELIDAEEKIAYYAEELQIVIDAIKQLKVKLPAHISKLLVERIAVYANRVFSKVYGGDYKIFVQDVGSGIQLAYGYEAYPSPVSSASGAESSLINVSVQLGLAEMAGLGILV